MTAGQRRLRRQLVLAVAAGAAVPLALGQSTERRVQVASADGNSAHSFADTITDFEAVSYVIALRRGQLLHVVLASNNAAGCFDIHAPNASKPVYASADSGNDHKLPVQVQGEYVVRVYLLRFAARDGQSARYTLELKVSA